MISVSRRVSRIVAANPFGNGRAHQMRSAYAGLATGLALMAPPTRCLRGCGPSSARVPVRVPPALGDSADDASREHRAADAGRGHELMGDRLPYVARFALSLCRRGPAREARPGTESAANFDENVLIRVSPSPHQAKLA